MRLPGLSATLAFLLAGGAASGAAGAAGLGFATSYGDHMVLQQSPKQAVVWGHCGAAGCGKITISLAAKSSATSQPAAPGGVPGTWIAKLPAITGGDTPFTVTVTDGTATATLSDVLFGDVWVCSGQSNMAFLLENAFNGSELVKDADNHPTIRMFTSKKNSSPEPLSEQPMVEENWTVSSQRAVSDDGCPKCNGSGTGGPRDPPRDSARDAAQTGDASWDLENLGDDNWLYMSAVCFIYGKNIQAHTGKPVGLLNTNWGGTPVEFWMSADAEEVGAACTSSSPGTVMTQHTSISSAGGAYNGMIKPLLNMTITGAIWYQGESNQGDPYSAGPDQHSGLPMMRYGCHFPAMIADWRTKWHAGSMGETTADFPFGFVNLAPWKNPNNSPAAVRWAQTAGYGQVPNAKMPNTFTALALDLTDNTSPYGSVHIRDKTTVGERLAAAAIQAVYGDATRYVQGPTVSTAAREGAGVTITFANTGVEGLQLMPAGPQDVAFEMCEAAKSNCSLGQAARGTSSGWQPAKVTGSTKTTVTVAGASSPERSAAGTVYVRYAWAAVPFQYKAAVLYGGDSKDAMLPAGGFVVSAHV